ncbi:hypothetical protein C4K26_2878 [Pseudomonas chlororaphis]|nr:hypothetical protein [Pseudomonas chlororaphis]AZD08281.1 hypothetical protein C4K26_2878 [Pseudomonas chlororaphis]
MLAKNHNAVGQALRGAPFAGKPRSYGTARFLLLWERSLLAKNSSTAG